MRILLKERVPGEIEYGIIYGTIAALILVAVRILPDDALPACVFRSITGFPCPTCGGTRSLGSLSRGDLLGSISLNPLVAVAVLAALLSLAARIVSLLMDLRQPVLVMTGGEGMIMRMLAAVFFLLHWAYLVFNL